MSREAIRARLTPVPDRHDPNGIEPGAEPELILIRASEVVPEPVEFIWAPYLAIGKFTLLQGDPGLGKTWLACKVAASVTLGESLPTFGVEAGPRDPGNVLYLSAEDGLADTLRPRLEAVGADLERVVFLEGIWRPGTRGRRVRSAISLRDSEYLRRAIEEVKPALLVIDPLLAYLGGADSNKAHEVREVLTPIVDLAEEHRFAALGIRHLNKATAARAHQRGQGSGDFTAAARSVLLLGQSPDGELAIVQIKNNVAPKGPAIAFELPKAGGFSWRGRSSLTEADLLAPDGKPSTKTLANRDGAREFLLTFLADGPQGVFAVKREADDRGISWATVRRAKEALQAEGTVRHRRISDGNQGNGEWEWYLVSQLAHNQSCVEQVAQDDPLNAVSTDSWQPAQLPLVNELPEPVSQLSQSHPEQVATIQEQQHSWQLAQEDSTPAHAHEEYLVDPEEEADASRLASGSDDMDEGVPW